MEAQKTITTHEIVGYSIAIAFLIILFWSNIS
jgi:hypothetical protein